MCYFQGKNLRKIIACGISEILYESKGLNTLVRNAKCTDMLNTAHTCIKVCCLCHLAVSCMSSVICAHISRTLDLVIIFFITNMAYM